MIIVKFKEKDALDEEYYDYGVLMNEEDIAETEEDSTGVTCLCCLQYFCKEDIEILKTFHGVNLESLIYQEYEKE